MSLIWHMVRKDFARLRWPLAIWLALILAHMLLVLGNLGLRKVNTQSYEGLSYFASTWGVIAGAVGFILAAWLVMEDSLVSTQAYWRTRPIHGARLLAAKGLGAFLMFSVLPAVVLTPVWLWCGFSAGEWTAAAGSLMWQQLFFSVAAFALAGITETSGQFLVRAIGAAVLLPVLLGFALGAFPRPDPGFSRGLLESRSWLILGLFFLTPPAMLGHQFLTRNTRRTVMIFGGALVLVLGVRFAWAWDFSPLLFKFNSDPQAAAADPGVKFQVDDQSVSEDMVALNTFNYSWGGVVTGVPADSYVRLNSARGFRLTPDNQWQTVGSLRIPLGRLETPPDQAVRAVAGLPAQTGASSIWKVEISKTPKWGRLQAELHASVMRGRTLGELPLAVGAELQVGSSLTRVISLERRDGLLVLQMEERDAGPGLPMGLYSGNDMPPSYRTRPPADGYVLLNRAQAYDQLAGVAGIGSIRANSITVSRHQLTFTPPTRLVDGKEQEVPGWAEGAVIVKVRFTDDHPLARIISN